MAVIISNTPSASVLASFTAGTATVKRWADIYLADNVTLWKSNVGMTSGSVSVDATRDERRNLDISLFDADGDLNFGAGGLWYDKIIKPYSGVVLPSTTEPGYVSLPGIAGNHISITRSALGSLTTLEFAVRVSLVSIGVAQKLAGWALGDAELTLDAANKLSVKVTSTTPTVIGGGLASVAVPLLAVNTKIWLKGKVTVSSAACDYAFSLTDTNDYDSAVWTTIGTTVTGTNAAAAVRLTNSTAAIFGTNAVANAGFAGKLHAASEYVNNAKTIEINPGAVAAGASTFAALTSQTVTVASSGGTIAQVIAAVTTPGDTWASPLGEFMIDKINRPRFPHDIKVTGRDFVKKLKLALFASTTSFPVGDNIATTIKTIATNGGIAKFNFAATTKTIGAVVICQRGDDRWTVCKKLAESIGHELFFDAFGYLTLRPFVDPLTAPVIHTFRTGPAVGNLANYERTTQDTFLFNDVIVFGDGPDFPLIFAEATNTNTTSPTRIAMIGTRTMTPIKNQFLTTNADALVLAQKILAVSSLESYDVNLDAIIAPWLESGTAVEFVAPDAAITDPTRFLLSNFSIPMTLGTMSCNVKRITIVG